jgi:FAD/FMN-containing dehydrogenase
MKRIFVVVFDESEDDVDTLLIYCTGTYLRVIPVHSITIRDLVLAT